jgi:hypothetical protein
MLFSPARRALTWLAGMSLTGFAAAAPFATHHDPVTPIAPLPALVAFAGAQGIPVERIDLAPADGPPRTGDSVVLLVTQYNKEVLQQWLARLRMDDLTPAEQLNHKVDSDKFHTSSGTAIDFSRTGLPLNVDFIGPFSAASPVDRRNDAKLQHHQRIFVAREYLEAGVDRYCRSALGVVERMKAADLKEIGWSFYGAPPAAADLAKGRTFAAAVQLTPDDERRSIEMLQTVYTVFLAAAKVAPFREVLIKTAERPSLWSLIRYRGVQLTGMAHDWRDVSLRGVDLPPGTTSFYQFPLGLEMNKQRVMNVTVAAGPMRRPLFACAGIRALGMENPSDPNKRLVIQLIAARYSDAPEKVATPSGNSL